MHTHTNRIPIATATEVAARLPSPHTMSGGWYRTSTAICHGGDTRHGLTFQDGDRPGESSLRVHCYSHNCDPTAIRHALQLATGLWLCRCDACFAAFRAGQPPLGANSAPTTTTTTRRPRVQTERPQQPLRTERTTADYAAELWAAAQTPTSGPAANHPVNRWLREKAPGGLWPEGNPLPQAVRWLARDHPRFPRGQPDSSAAGALVMAMRPLDNPTAPPRKIQLVAIDKAGRKAHHWPDKGDKRTYGSGPAYGLLWRGEIQLAAYALHICEGLADGLRILRYAPDPALVAVCAGTAYARIAPGYFNTITLWPDADEPGVRAAEEAGQLWANQGYDIRIMRLPAGHDPASAPLQGKERHEDQV